MMIRAHMRGVAEVDIGFFPMRQSFDPREFLLEPLLHQRLVPFQRTMQRLLASDAQLGQKPSDRDQAQRDLEFIFDQRRHHLTRPQRKCELELQRILLRHRVVNPLQLLAIEFRRTSEQRLGLQRSPATTSILCQPAIDRRTIDTQNTSNNFRAFAVLNTAHRTLTHCLQRGMIQPSSIVLPHAQRESYSHRHVKNSLFTCVLINRSRRRCNADSKSANPGGGPKRVRGKKPSIKTTQQNRTGAMTGIAFDDQPPHSSSLTDYDRYLFSQHVSCSGCRVQRADSVHRSTERRDETGSAPLDRHYRTALTGEGDSPAILFEC